MDNLQVLYKDDEIMLALGDRGIKLTRAEAEQLFVDLGHALQDQDVRNEK